MNSGLSPGWQGWLQLKTRELEMRKVRARAEDAAEERILDILVPPARDFGFATATPPDEAKAGSTARQTFRKRLREGAMNDHEIEIEVAEPRAHMEIMAPPGMEEMTEQLRGRFGQMGQQKKQTRKLKISEAYKLAVDEEAAKLLQFQQAYQASAKMIQIAQSIFDTLMQGLSR